MITDLELKIADFYETAKTIFSQVSPLSYEGLSLRLEKKQIRIVAVQVSDPPSHKLPAGRHNES